MGGKALKSQFESTVMTSGNSKWVRAILTTAVILAITAMMVPAMVFAQVTFTTPPYNASGYVIYITVPKGTTTSYGTLYVYLNSSDTGSVLLRNGHTRKCHGRCDERANNAAL